MCFLSARAPLFHSVFCHGEICDSTSTCGVCPHLPFQARVSRIQQIEKDILRLGAHLQV